MDDTRVNEFLRHNAIIRGRAQHHTHAILAGPRDSQRLEFGIAADRGIIATAYACREIARQSDGRACAILIAQRGAHYEMLHIPRWCANRTNRYYDRKGEWYAGTDGSWGSNLKGQGELAGCGHRSGQ